MTKFIVSSLRLVAVIALFTLSSCGKKANSVSKAPPSNNAIEEIRQKHPGDILLLLFGKEGCPGTAKATAVLDSYMKNKPDGVTVIRIDVPLPGKDAELPEKWNHSFEDIADKNREMASALSFFYYPTLYIFDKDGVLRFQGGCDLQEVSDIVQKILAEKPDSEKVIYTKIMPETGTPAPDFDAETIDGIKVSLRNIIGNKGALLLFTRKSCPFSRKAVNDFQTLIPQFREAGITTALIVEDEGEDSCLGLKKYADKMYVIPDHKNKIFNKYAVTATPYFYFIDSCGNIFAHRSFTEGAALNTMNGFLEQARVKDSFNISGAG